MKRRQTGGSVIAGFGSLAFVLVVWALFSPAQFGGNAAYVLVSGISMEPTLQRDDLVILRRSAEYAVGDIVTYLHPQIGPVIHRIIAATGDHFLLQGDNNSWADTHQPVADEMIGRLWLRLPGLGKLVKYMRQPWAAALLAIGLAAMAGGPMLLEFLGVSRREPPAVAKGSMEVMAMSNDPNREWRFALAMVALGAVVFGLVAFTRQPTRLVADNINYRQSGEFAYVADAPPGLYRDDEARTGEPIFRRLINRVTFTFDYSLTADGLPDARGAYRVSATIAASNGWQQEIELLPETPFEGASFSAQFPVELTTIQTMIDRMEQQTGVTSSQYALTIRPEVTVAGNVSGESLADRFSPSLVFQLDRLQMQLAGGRGSLDPDDSSALRPAVEGEITRTRPEPSALAIMGLSIPVAAARSGSLGVLAVCLLGIGALGLRRPRRAAPAGSMGIARRLGDLVIEVESAGLAPGVPLVHVASDLDLRRIAERTGRMILHETNGASHRFVLHADGTTYCFQQADPFLARSLPCEAQA